MVQSVCNGDVKAWIAATEFYKLTIATLPSISIGFFLRMPASTMKMKMIDAIVKGNHINTRSSADDDTIQTPFLAVMPLGHEPQHWSSNSARPVSHLLQMFGVARSHSSHPGKQLMQSRFTKSVA